MTPALVLGLACILFLWAIILGIMLAFARFGKEKNPPPVLVWWHGGFAITGFLILLYGSFFVGYPILANVGVFLIALAAMFGLWMYFNFHRKEELIPYAIVWGHGIVAASGFIMILIAMLNIADTTQA
jgi:ABC-type amino acid transport system permease subunit